jgi:uncharacterized protein YcfJ
VAIAYPVSTQSNVVVLVIGGFLGMEFGATSGNTALGLVVGALGGLFIGWFAAAAAHEKRSGK